MRKTREGVGKEIKLFLGHENKTGKLRKLKSIRAIIK